MIVENYRICRKQEVENLTGDSCIDNALRGINASCTYEERRDEMDIKPINEHTLIIRNAIKPVLLDSSCNIRARKVTGTLLISFPNCSISINGTIYDGSRTRDYHEIRIIPTIGVDFHVAALFNKPSLQQLNMLRIDNRNHIERLREDHAAFRDTMTGFLIFLTITFTGAIILLVRRRLRMPKDPSSEVNFCNNKKTLRSFLSTERKQVEPSEQDSPTKEAALTCRICQPEDSLPLKDSGRIFPKGGRNYQTNLPTHVQEASACP